MMSQRNMAIRFHSLIQRNDFLSRARNVHPYDKKRPSKGAFYRTALDVKQKSVL